MLVNDRVVDACVDARVPSERIVFGAMILDQISKYWLTISALT
jgi:hypothetical protein